mgnify:CR=1 FL=1
MGVTFSEGRGLPREFTKGGGYEGFGDDMQDGAAKIAHAVLPWDLLTGLFVTKPQSEQAAQVAIAQAQAEAQGDALAIRGVNTRMMVLVGGGIVGVLAVGLLLMKLNRPSRVSGYRRKSRRTRRSRR